NWYAPPASVDVLSSPGSNRPLLLPSRYTVTLATPASPPSCRPLLSVSANTMPRMTPEGTPTGGATGGGLTVHENVAAGGAGPTLPAWSTACTRKVCGPGARVASDTRLPAAVGETPPSRSVSHT